MVWQEEKRSMITSVQMGNPTNLLGIRRIDIIPNEQARFVWCEERMWVEVLMKGFSDETVILKEWRINGLLKVLFVVCEKSSRI